MTAPPGSKVVPAVLPSLGEEKDVRRGHEGKGGNSLTTETLGDEDSDALRVGQ